MRYFGLILLFLSFGIFSFAQQKEQDLVKAAFENYKSAILNDKDAEAIKYVDSRTIKYYDEISEKVRKADSLAIEKFTILDKVMVFSVRHRATREDMLGFDGKKLFMFAIREGMVGKNSVQNNGIGKVTINNKPTPLDFHFYKEDNQWKLDLTALFEVSENVFKEMVEGSGQSESEFLFTILESITGKRPGNEIWKPVLK